MKPSRVIRYHDGLSWVFAVASEPGPKLIHLAVQDGSTDVRMTTVPKEEARRFQDVEYDLARWCKQWLRPRDTLGRRREITGAAREFLQQGVPT